MRQLSFGSALLALTSCFSPSTDRKNDQGFAIILQAGAESHEGLARALHALLYAEELHASGYPVVLVFDGAGTEWAEAMRKPDHKLHARFSKLKARGLVDEVCDYCAGAFKVKDGLKQMSEVALVAEFEGHPSIAKWVKRGYQILIL